MSNVSAKKSMSRLTFIVFYNGLPAKEFRKETVNVDKALWGVVSDVCMMYSGMFNIKPTKTDRKGERVEGVKSATEVGDKAIDTLTKEEKHEGAIYKERYSFRIEADEIEEGEEGRYNEEEKVFEIYVL